MSLYPTEGQGLTFFIIWREVVLSLYPMEGQGLTSFNVSREVFLSLYSTKGKGLYIVITSLGIRGVLGELLVPDHLLVVAAEVGIEEKLGPSLLAVTTVSVEVGVESQLGPSLHYNHDHHLVANGVSVGVGIGEHLGPNLQAILTP